MLSCKGTFRALFLFDVADEIDLSAVRLSIAQSPKVRGFKIAAPAYVRFERPPAEEDCSGIVGANGEPLSARIRYFDYGAVSVQVQIPFECTWDDLVLFSERAVEIGELEPRALAAARRHIERLAQTLRKPYTAWLDETYYVVELQEVRDHAGSLLTGGDLASGYRSEISQLVRGELVPLAAAEEREVLASSISYYRTDLLVVGWETALIYDTPDGIAVQTDLLEYANTQLLEFRRYDEVLTGVLTNARMALEHEAGPLSRWTLPRAAENLNRLRLEVMELAERTDNAIKFLSDMYYARAYRLATSKVGVDDYRRLTDQKLAAAGDLYEFMVNEFREARGFVLEVLVVIILVIELVLLLQGK